MICSQISSLIGISCHPLTDDGDVAMIDTSFAFEDGAGIPVYVEKVGEHVRFFDDGGVILHLRGRGVNLDDNRKTRFIKSLAEPVGVTLSDMGELEIWANAKDSPSAFAKYISAMLALVRWEHDQIGVGTDMTLFIGEVAFCLRALKPGAELIEEPEYRGISGHVYKLDFNFDGSAVIAISTHPNSVSSAAKKLLDIRGAEENSGLKVLVVIDDRPDEEGAKNEGRILDSVANVWMMSRLEKQAGLARLAH